MPSKEVGSPISARQTRGKIQRLDPLTMRYLNEARSSLGDALWQTKLAIERARSGNAESELRVLYALADQDEARTKLRRALVRLESQTRRRDASR